MGVLENIKEAERKFNTRAPVEEQLGVKNVNEFIDKINSIDPELAKQLREAERKFNTAVPAEEQLGVSGLYKFIGNVKEEPDIFKRLRAAEQKFNTAAPAEEQLGVTRLHDFIGRTGSSGDRSFPDTKVGEPQPLPSAKKDSQSFLSKIGKFLNSSGDSSFTDAKVGAIPVGGESSPAPKSEVEFNVAEDFRPEAGPESPSEALTPPGMSSLAYDATVSALEERIRKLQEGKPDALTGLLNSLTAQTKSLAGQPEPATAPGFASALEAAAAQLTDEYNKSKDRLAIGEIAESFAKGLTFLGAGLYGLKHGVDMSGVKFDPTNWESKYDRLMAEHTKKIQTAADIQQMKMGEEREARIASQQSAELEHAKKMDAIRFALQVREAQDQNAYRLADLAYKQSLLESKSDKDKTSALNNKVEDTIKGFENSRNRTITTFEKARKQIELIYKNKGTSPADKAKQIQTVLSSIKTANPGSSPRSLTEEEKKTATEASRFLGFGKGVKGQDEVLDALMQAQLNVEQAPYVVNFEGFGPKRFKNIDQLREGLKYMRTDFEPLFNYEEPPSAEQE